MRGTEATSKIRALGFEGIVIAVTGNALPEDVEDFLNHGADAVMPKPFDQGTFKQVVTEILASKSLSISVAQNGRHMTGNHLGSS